MGYDGYSNIGDMELSDFWKKQMKKGIARSQNKPGHWRFIITEHHPTSQKYLR